MPARKFIQCKACLELSEDPYTCVYCGAQIGAAANLAPHVYSFPSGYWEHLDIEPVYIRGRAQLREECSRRGLTALYTQ